MSETPEIGAYHTRPPWYWIALPVLVFITLGCGTRGYWDYNHETYLLEKRQEAAMLDVLEKGAKAEPAYHFANQEQALTIDALEKAVARGEKPVGPPGKLDRFFEAAYGALQLFLLHTPEFDRPPNAWLETGRVSGMIVFVCSIVLAFWRIYQMRFRHSWYHWSRGHVVICGAGWRGLALARDFREGRLPAKRNYRNQPYVIVIERDPDTDGVRQCDLLGIPYLIGDATDPKFLSSVGVRRAHELIAVCGSDEVNLEIAIRARDLGRPATHPPLKCHVHLANDDLRAMVRQKGFAPHEGTAIEISTFGTDLYENTARRLFVDNADALDRMPITETSPLRVHLIILGFGPMGQAVLAHAACIAHFANGLPLRVTVVDPQAARLLEEFAQRRTELARVAEVLPVSRSPHDAAVVSLVAAAGKEPNFLVTCVICFPDEKLNLALAVKMDDAIQGRSVPIRWWLQARSDVGLGLVFSDRLQSELVGRHVKPFGTMDQVCNAQSLELEEADRMGKAMHDSYVAEQMKKGDTPENNSSLRPWDALSENFKNSNRLAADHIPVKMRAIGYRLEKLPATADRITEFTPEQVELMSRMEHARYLAERFMDGWRPSAEDPVPDPQTGALKPAVKDPVRKTNPTLIPWDDLDHPERSLPEKEREKDREQVRKIPEIVHSAGWYIRR